jgi:hypothetical protein
MAGIPVYVLMRWRQHREIERQHAAELERMGVVATEMSDEELLRPTDMDGVTRAEAMQ